MKNHLLTALIALGCGFAGAALWSLSGLGHDQTREYPVSYTHLTLPTTPYV